MPDTWRAGAGGVLELVNEKGEIIAIEKKREVYREGRLVRKFRGRPSTAAAQTHHFVRDSRGRKIWVPKGTNPDDLPQLIWPYSQVTVDLILQKIREGMTVIAIGKTEGFPPHGIIFKWKAEHPEFKAAYILAKKDRADYHAELAIEEAQFAKESKVQSDRLRVETYKWAAEVGDRDTFGKSTKIVGDPNQPIGFIIDTGIRRDPPAPVAPQPLPEPGSPAEIAVQPPKENPS